MMMDVLKMIYWWYEVFDLFVLTSLKNNILFDYNIAKWRTLFIMVLQGGKFTALRQTSKSQLTNVWKQKHYFNKLWNVWCKVDYGV